MNFSLSVEVTSQIGSKNIAQRSVYSNKELLKSSLYV